MAATKQDVDRWIERGIRTGSRFIISVCDTFDYEDYPVYCKDEQELAEKRSRYDGKNMQEINEVIDLNDHQKEVEVDQYPEHLLMNLPDIFAAIRNGDIHVGINKGYCFVTDEDGLLVFLKRPKDAVIGEILEDGPRTQWPYNSGDGTVLYERRTGDNRGVDITQDFLDILDVDFLG